MDNKVLIEALEYYSDKGNYYCPEAQVADIKDLKFRPTNADEGRRAREALQRYKHPSQHNGDTCPKCTAVRPVVNLPTQNREVGTAPYGSNKCPNCGRYISANTQHITMAELCGCSTKTSE